MIITCLRFALQSLDGKKQLTKTVHYMNRYYGELIGNTIGRVLDVDVDNNNTGWDFFLVRVILNLFKPLARGWTILVKEEDLWEHVKYEKLPKFCYCGLIIHEDGGCQSKELHSTDQFGPWLKAEAQRRPWSRKGEGGSSDQLSETNTGTLAEGREPLDPCFTVTSPEEDINQEKN